MPKQTFANSTMNYIYGPVAKLRVPLHARNRSGASGAVWGSKPPTEFF